MSYYGKKAQKGSGRIDKSANSDFLKGKTIYDRKKRDKIRDDYIRDDYAKQEHLANERDIETVSTSQLVELNNADLRYRYEGTTDTFTRSNKQHHSRSTKSKSDKLQTEHYKKSSKGQVSATDSISNTGKSAASNASGYAGSALEIKDSVTPESLKLQNYSAKKNYQRYKELQNKENGNVDPTDDAISKTGSYISSTGSKISKAWVAIGKLLWRINWIAGLIYTCVSILLVAIIGILFICSIPNTENESSISAGQAVAEFAAGEIGNHGSKYNNWRGAAPGTAWCQNFVEYVLHKSGYSNLASGAGGVTTAYKYYKNNPKVATIHVVEGKSKEKLGVTPQPGWLIVFEWADGDKYRDHIGIVESYDSSTGIVTTIEGNTWVGRNKPLRTSVCRVHRKVGISPEKKHIYAFIELAYPKSKT